MSKFYFKNFPYITYNDKIARNLILKSVFFQKVIDSYSSFYPYTVKEGERADTIAYDYYGSSDYYWLVYLSNQLIDPYFEWPLTDYQLTQYLIKKYGSPAQADAIIDYYVYQSQPNITDLESYYNANYIMEPETYNKLVQQYQSNPNTTDMRNFNPTNWTPVTAYQAEIERNESRRNIKLLSKAYLSQVDREISGIFR